MFIIKTLNCVAYLKICISALIQNYAIWILLPQHASNKHSDFIARTENKVGAKVTALMTPFPLKVDSSSPKKPSLPFFSLKKAPVKALKMLVDSAPEAHLIQDVA